MLSRYGETEGRFSADEIEDKIDDFEELAASRVNNAPTGRFLLAVGIFGALVIPCGLPAAGAIALPILVNAIKSATKNGQQAEYIARTGNFCHLLNHREIAQLIRFTGRKFIVDQCVAAHIDGMRLTGAAIELVEMVEGRLTPSTFAEVKKAYATNLQNQSEQRAEPAIANDSEQNTVDVPAIAVQAPDAIPQNSTPSNEMTNPLPSFSPINYLVGDRLRTSLIISVSGGGKDILLSNALRSFLSIYPKFTVIVMDCKNDPKETGYYAELDRVTFYRLNLAISSDSTISAWIDAILDDFNGRPECCLLICNEGTLIREKSKRYADVVKSLVSSGDSRQKYCWEAGQSAHNDDLKTNGASRSRFRPLMIGMLGEEMQIEAVLQAKWFADSARDLSAITSEMRRSPVRRAWCDGMRWYPMPELPNHSGYDRDARTFVVDCEPKNDCRVAEIKSSEDTKQSAQSDAKANTKKPELSRKEIMLVAAELAEWLDQTGIADASNVYEKWQSRKHGFSRPEIRYLLTLIDSDL
ncbi:hypothetical protein [Leptolyngbya sp. NIES-2104]|uniref:hypothetical protein n=1 Tax=Leptolyngbya sp. NIES-2104 TaxID=1552121 RepID=UPI0006EC9488|nr:hypothetical protein [Leptolyngbya sp. NIES-2104]GAQ00121.1 hypothetical protein NIES2104_66860 [Leptolyngbya sp. NIES-2104]